MFLLQKINKFIQLGFGRYDNNLFLLAKKAGKSEEKAKICKWVILLRID